MIARLGFDLLTAADGSEGVAVFRQHADEIDLVILDMKMPGLSGGEAMAEIRSIREDAKVILSSGYPQEEELAMDAGHAPSDFIQKPYRLSLLRSKLRAVLDG